MLIVYTVLCRQEKLVLVVGFSTAKVNYSNISLYLELHQTIVF